MYSYLCYYLLKGQLAGADSYTIQGLGKGLCSFSLTFCLVPRDRRKSNEDRREDEREERNRRDSKVTSVLILPNTEQSIH